MSNLGDFSKRIKQIADDIATGTDGTVIQTAIVVQQTVILSTPVDTGRARANWLASIGTPLSLPIVDEDKSGGNIISKNNTTIAGRKTGQNVYISNNLPYIKKLNEGWSKQAPAGFVELAVKSATAYLKNVRILK